MGHVTLAIRQMQDENMLLRQGGLYWIALDLASDADMLARQFLSALTEQHLATLVSTHIDPQTVVESMDADCGPSALRLFAVPGSARKFLTSLTADLHRINLARDSHLVLMLSADSLENFTGLELQRWCESTRQWLVKRNCTLLVLCSDQAPQLHEKLLDLNEQISGLAQLYRQDGGVRYQLNFWHSSLGVCAAQAFDLKVTDGAFAQSKSPSSSPFQVRTDDQRIYLTQRAVLEGTAPLSEQWRLFEKRSDLLEQAAHARAASVIVALESNSEVEPLARQLHHLRDHCGVALKIIVREMEPCLRYRDERLLLACGANLIVPANTQLANFLSMVDSVQGLTWHYRQTPDFQSLFERLRPPAQRGLVSPQEFIALLDQVYSGASGELVHQLLSLRPRGDLNIDQYLNQISLRRYGDVACVVNGVFYLFLFACRGDGLEPALGNICRLPWRDLFTECKSLSAVDMLPRQDFLDASQLLETSRLATEQVTADLTQAIIQVGYAPQRITLTLSEHCS
ncbi:cellulose biosynthesis protein BcsE [Pseudomonas sp. ICMP 561]|uniref:cellulose biosynthesis protein BcsE n=1 Tax=Pseudomonas sp. ICMP 561 TaxID=1718918 RepID=UPI000C06A5F6|nr:cellulose biosynthesis protein BcsE [Pseudomonas sp. ICMP 561]PHN28501.1 protease [Pseudomonas sp. ICMP 561]